MSEKTLGTIGELYENRKTGKKGKLVDRDDKYKTVMIELEDGKSMSVTYSTFRSNWRKPKYSIEEVEDFINDPVDTAPEEVFEEIKDEPLIEETVTGEVVVEQTVEETPAKKRAKAKKSLNPSSGYFSDSLFEPLMDTIEEYVKSFDADGVMTFARPTSPKAGKPKHMAAIKIGKHRELEIWCRARENSYEFYMRPNTFDAVNWRDDLDGIEVMFTEEFNMEKHFKVPSDKLNNIIRDMKPAFRALIKEETKKLVKEESEEK